MGFRVAAVPVGVLRAGAGVPGSGARDERAATQQDPFTFTTANGAAAITKYAGRRGAVVIPDQINGLPVTGIGDEAFMGCASLLDVTILATVTGMGGSAFGNCPNLTSIHFNGNAPNLGQDVFHGSTKATIYHLPTAKGWGKEFGGRPTKVWEPDKK